MALTPEMQGVSVASNVRIAYKSLVRVTYQIDELAAGREDMVFEPQNLVDGIQAAIAALNAFNYAKAEGKREAVGVRG